MKKSNLEQGIEEAYRYILGNNPKTKPDEDLYQEVACEYIEFYQHDCYSHEEICQIVEFIIRSKIKEYAKNPKVTNIGIICHQNHISMDMIEKCALENDACRQLHIIIENTLRPRETEVLIYRFGLNDYDYKTLEELGVMQGCSKERVRQIEAKALRKMRHPSISNKIKHFFD